MNTETTTTRTGKIARLPRRIREQLNCRLDDGESGETILAWLNALPEVQAGDAPITAQNLCNWRQGGFQDWAMRLERGSVGEDILANGLELEGDTGPKVLVRRLVTVWLLEFVVATQAMLRTVTDPAERCQKLREAMAVLAKVRQQDYQEEKLALERERQKLQKDANGDNAGGDLGAMALLMSQLGDIGGGGAPAAKSGKPSGGGGGGTEHGGTQNPKDQPQNLTGQKTVQVEQTGSNPVPANQGQSSQIKPAGVTGNGMKPAAPATAKPGANGR